MSHTPGPWETHWTHDKTGYPKFYIHGFAADAKRDSPVMDANANLIAAAPELLTALKSVEWHGHGMNRCPCCFGWEASGNGETDRHHNAGCVLANAIAKAEGR
jgi:hypothetical protein